MRTSKWMIKVQQKSRLLPKKLPRTSRSDAQLPCNAAYRQRCQVVVNLVRGRSQKSIAKHLHCSDSTVGRVAQRFVDDGLAGLVDHRERNGEVKISDDLEALLLQQAACCMNINTEHQRVTPTEFAALTIAERFPHPSVGGRDGRATILTSVAFQAAIGKALT